MQRMCLYSQHIRDADSCFILFFLAFSCFFTCRIPRAAWIERCALWRRLLRLWRDPL